MLKINIDKEYLYQKYIVDEISVTDIANEIGCTKEVIYRRLREFDFISLKKNKIIEDKEKYKDKDWLYQKYIVENLSPVEIAKELGYSNRLGSKRVDYYRSKFGFKKPKQKSQIAKSRATEQTNLKRYGVKSTLSLTKNQEKYNAPKIFIDNKKISDFIIGKKYSWHMVFYTLKAIDNDRTHFSSKEFYENYNSAETALEKFVSKELNLERYNYLFEKEKYPKLRYRPDFKINEKIGLNVDGLYWHSELFKNSKYHFDMRKEYEDRNLRILQFRENEVYNKTDIVKSIIRNSQGLTSNRIGARKTKIKVVPNKEAKVFLEKNHIKGSKKAKHVGLYYKEHLVQIISYKIYGTKLKIERLCGKVDYSIIGGYSKLEKYLLKENPRIKTIEYWVDLRYGTGNFLKKLGYKKEKDILSWEWTDYKETYNRLKCRANIDERRLSQAEYAKELNWTKIYDAGQRLYIKSF